MAKAVRVEIPLKIFIKKKTTYILGANTTLIGLVHPYTETDRGRKPLTYFAGAGYPLFLRFY